VSDRVRQRVVAATNETGYVPTVGRKSTSNIALVYTGESSLGSPFEAALMFGMSRGMEEYSYDLMILDARRSKLPHETYTQMFVRKGVRGAVIRTTAATRSVCQSIVDEGFPTIVVADRFENPNVNFIYSDSRESSREAVEHLIGLGHRRIAVCVNIVDDSDHADRLAGYRQALSENGIDFDRKLVLRTPANREGGWQLMRRIMAMPNRPTAVFLTDPMTVVGVMAEARKMGVEIPRDLSIVGFDDSELRYSVSPEMTAVCQDAAALGREAFKALYGMLDQVDGAPIVKKAMRTWLEIHGSTAPPLIK
jgi:DNA-binding LacI/PurR family transcriptional regulator